MLVAELTDGLPALTVRHLCDATGVHDADVCNVLAGGGLHPRSLHLLLDGARLCEVEFAAERVIGRFLSFYCVHATKLRLFPENTKFFKKR